jgi:hypothetical protein
VGIQQRRANKEHGRKPCKYPILSTHMFIARKDGQLSALFLPDIYSMSP